MNIFIIHGRHSAALAGAISSEYGIRSINLDSCVKLDLLRAALPDCTPGKNAWHASMPFMDRFVEPWYTFRRILNGRTYWMRYIIINESINSPAILLTCPVDAAEYEYLSQFGTIAGIWTDDSPPPHQMYMYHAVPVDRNEGCSQQSMDGEPGAINYSHLARMAMRDLYRHGLFGKITIEIDPDDDRDIIEHHIFKLSGTTISDDTGTFSLELSERDIDRMFIEKRITIAGQDVPVEIFPW